MASQNQQNQQTAEQAAEQAAIRKSADAALYFARGIEGGRDNSSQQRGLNFLSLIMSDKLSGWKSAEKTESEIARVASGLDHDDLAELIACGKAAIDNLTHLLTTKFQSPLKGGDKPSRLGHDVVSVISPASKQAVKLTVLSRLTKNI